MKNIYKYILDDVDIKNVKIKGTPISVINQRENICVYALVDEDSVEKTYEFFIAGTGNSVPDEVAENFTFLGTASFVSGNIILHIFYKEIA